MVQTRTDLHAGFVEQLCNTGLRRSYCATLLNTKQGRRNKCFGRNETETRIEAEVEIDIREAPLRELSMEMPAGYGVIAGRRPARPVARGTNDGAVFTREG